MVKRKICFLSPNAYPVLANTRDTGFGGAEVKQVFTAIELFKHGYDITFITRDFGQTRVTVHNGIKVVKIGSKHLHTERGSFYKGLIPLWLTMKFVNADIYFQRGAGAITGVMAIFCKVLKKKLVYCVASSYDVDGGYIRKASKRNAFLYRYGLRNSERIIVQAKEFEDILRRRHGLESVFIRDGHDIPDYVVPSNGREYVIFIGGIRPVKRPDIFIELCKQCPEKKFLMLGGALGDKKYFEQIKKKAQSMSNIDFKGHVSRDEVGDYLRKAIVLVNTSEREGLANTMTEAWSYGVPVISFSINPDNLLEGKLGFCCRDDFDTMIKYLKEIFANGTMYARMSDDCRRYAVENHDIKNVINEYVKVIESV